MFFYKTRRKLLKKFVEYYNYHKVLFQSSKIKPSDKVIYIDVSGIALNRYLYNFLKFFQINNYTVYLPKNKNIITQLCQDKGEFEYASWLLKERFVKFDEPPNSPQVLKISKEQLSNDYFSSFFINKLEKETYHVPMSEYPTLYHKYDWRKEFSIEMKRKRSVFMIGNINKKYYDNIAKEKVFNILSRRAIADFIFKQKYYININSIIELERYIESEIDKKVILIDTSVNFKIGGEKLKIILQGFDFYFAAPGIIIPQSHNIIEAMSVGNIPILHKTYANLFRPVLQNNINCLIYETIDEMNNTINKIFDLPDEKILNLRKNVSEYYIKNLTPEAVVTKIENNNYIKIFLQAEGISLNYLKK